MRHGSLFFFSAHVRGTIFLFGGFVRVTCFLLVYVNGVIEGFILFNGMLDDSMMDDSMLGCWVRGCVCESVGVDYWCVWSGFRISVIVWGNDECKSTLLIRGVGLYTGKMSMWFFEWGTVGSLGPFEQVLWSLLSGWESSWAMRWCRKPLQEVRNYFQAFVCYTITGMPFRMFIYLFIFFVFFRKKKKKTAWRMKVGMSCWLVLYSVGATQTENSPQGPVWWTYSSLHRLTPGKL